MLNWRDISTTLKANGFHHDKPLRPGIKMTKGDQLGVRVYFHGPQPTYIEAERAAAVLREAGYVVRVWASDGAMNNHINVTGYV